MVEVSNFFKEIKKHPDRFYLIHYSSQGLFDEGLDGMSPKITSIVVMHYATGQTVSFAVHTEAETLGIPRDQVAVRYNEIELQLLTRFYNFARDRRERNWVHWNMRNIVYGFEHLEHRYRLLTGLEPPSIPVEVRLNLNDALKVRYGPDYAGDPRMRTLMLLNGPLSPQFLSGAEEAEAFRNGEYVRLNSSTISKVQFFQWLIKRALIGKLRTAGKSFANLVDRVLESRAARMWALAGTSLGVLLGLYNIVKLLLSAL
jgi:hypothetical protein